MNTLDLLREQRREKSLRFNAGYDDALNGRDPHSLQTDYLRGYDFGTATLRLMCATAEELSLGDSHV